MCVKWYVHGYAQACVVNVLVVYVGICGHTHEGRRTLRVGLFLLSCGSWGFNSDCQFTWQEFLWSYSTGLFPLIVDKVESKAQG